MASKKIPMTVEIKEKLKRDFPSIFVPKEIVVTSETEPDHIFLIKPMTNIEYFSYIKDVRKCDPSDEMEFSVQYLELGMKHIIPKIVEWTNGDSDYTDKIEEYIPYVKTDILFTLFSLYQESLD